MERKFAVNEFAATLARRPALAQYIVSCPDAVTLAKFIYHSRTAKYVKSCWLSADVLQAYLAITLNENRGRYPSCLPEFPLSIRELVTPKLVAAVCENYPSSVFDFPHAPYELYLKAVSHFGEQTLSDYPVRYLTEELIVDYIATRGNRGDLTPYITQSIVNKLLMEKPSRLDDVPKEFITKELLSHVLKYDVDINDYYPEASWDQALAEQAVSQYAYAIKYIPIQYITTEMCLKAAQHPHALNYIPKKFHTKDVVLQSLVSARVFTGSDISLDITSEQMLMQLMKLEVERPVPTTQCWGLVNWKGACQDKHRPGMTPDLWVKVLNVCPSAIQHLPKEEQTSEMVTAFLTTASTDELDGFAKYLNLARIKKEHAPYLIGTTQARLLDVVTRKLAPKARVKRGAIPNEPVFEPDMVSLDIPDSLYREIAGIR